ncbi:MAG: Sir2 family NAD-dependent protein deacetylase, partial [Roseiflexaceae bacterium]|nr:Sir2 family NAD-dependent protein deacetylase [Roseiflexaceae bacterium]
MTLPESVISHLRNAKRVVALTGGGVASEANFPTFLQAHTGEWARYDVSELATPQAFLRNPRLVWEWYAHRRRGAERLGPSATHRALVALEQFYPSFTLITQTIDGLHMRAGSEQVIELNGCLSRSRCYEAGHILQQWEEVGEIPPRCPHCGSFLRPDVVMYGEGLSQIDLRRARQAVEQCDTFLCLGAIGAIEPVSSFPFAARRARARVIAIAPDESVYTLLADDIIIAPPANV